MDGQTLESLADMICGDGEEYPVYRTGSELTRFFRRVGFSNLVHDGSTRKWWTLSVLEQLSDRLKRGDSSGCCNIGKGCSVVWKNHIVFLSHTKAESQASTE